MAMATAILLAFTVMAELNHLVSAQAAPTVSPTAAPSPPITCTLPNSSMVSSNYCNSNAQQSMQTQTAGCNGFLLNKEPAPSAACCKGLNDVAYNQTSCVCSYTFYPPSENNATRQLQLPGLCGLTTNLCGKCPTFLVTRSNEDADAASPPLADAPAYKEAKSMASTIGAISLAVVFGLLLVGGIIGLTLTLLKKRRAKLNALGPFEPAPPGGVF